jgi:O-antigen ligase
MENLISRIKTINPVRDLSLSGINLTIVLCLIVFFIRLPPIFLIRISPFNSIFMTHNIARFLIIVVFIVAFLTRYKHPQSSLDKKLCFLLGLFFLSQSISVLYAQNIGSFFTVYKDLILSIMLFFSLFFIVEKDNQMVFLRTLVLATAINISFQMLAYFHPSFISDYLKGFFNERYWDFFTYQTNRGRFFGEFFDEVSLPFIFYFLTSAKKSSNKLILNLFICAIFFITFVSSWRSKSILLLFAFIGSIIIYFKQMKRILIFQILMLYILLTFANFISLEKVGQNILDRFIFTDYQEVRIVKSRFTYLIEALNMGLESPLFGVGLGNYYDNLSVSSKMENQSPGYYLSRKFIVIDDPHNIFISTFATTGFFGLFSLILLILYFLYHDTIRFLTSNQLLLKASMVSFWSLFVYALFNPWMYFAYLMFFMFLRGYIEKLSVLYKS